MKSLNLALLLFLSASGAASQTSQNAPDVHDIVVIKSSWHQVVRNPALDEDPLRAADETAALERAQRDTVRENVRRAGTKQDPLQLPISTNTTHDAPGRASVEYVYEVKINNTGSKTIRELVWEYVLIDPATQREVGHHQFTSEVSIHPGKTKLLVGRTKFPPASIVDAKKARAEKPGQYLERIVIHRVEYDHDSAQKRVSN